MLSALRFPIAWRIARAGWRMLAAAMLLLAGQLAGTAASAQNILRDAETEAFFRDIGKPLMLAGQLDPNTVGIYMIGDPSINAFATLGQNVFIHSGLVIAADDVLELQGVLAHELGHVAGGHAVRFNEGAAPATNISLLSLALAAGLIAAGGTDAGLAVLMAGQQAAQGKFLAFNREQESRTDQAGARFLDGAGVDGTGMISFFRTLQGDEYRLAIAQDNAYNRTHPLSGERIAALEEVLQRSKSWEKGADPVLQARYQRIRAKLIGFVLEPAETLKAYPPTDTSDPARVARAYAYHKAAFPDKALAEVDAVLQRSPKDAYVLELKGQVLLESGRVADSLPPLRAAVAESRGDPLIAGMLGHALVQAADASSGDPNSSDATLAEAEKVLRTAIARDNQNPFAWLQLGTVYERRGDTPRAALATAERLNLSGGDPGLAARSAQVAVEGLPKNTPDWLRAQDILLVSQDQMRNMKKDRNGRGPRG